MTRKVAIRGAKGGSSSTPRTPIESADSLRSTQFARIVDLISEGEISGLANPAKPLTCVFLNETPVANSDGTLNFNNVQFDMRMGTQTQSYVPGFEGVENELSIGVELKQSTPWTRAITNVNLNAVRINMSLPALSQQNTTTGDLTGFTVNYHIDVKTDAGAYVTVLTMAFTGKTSQTYTRSHRIALPHATTGWTIRVVRDTADTASASIQDTTMIDSYTEIIDAKLRMPMSAYAALLIDAEQFNAIPSRAFHVRGRIIQVPTNYNPTTRVYTGVWDGTFQPLYSNNPAWTFYDMAINDRYGCGKRVNPALIDKWFLYTIARYCDELVPDGFGGMEPRFTCNISFQAQSDALRVMQDLASVFRGIMYASGGMITAVADSPADPSYTYTAANVIGGKFTYSGSGGSVRHSVALVSWNDPADFYRAKVEYVDDDDAIARYGIQITEVIAPGCTSRGQARRFGAYILATEYYEDNLVGFSVGMDGTVVAPGKIVNIADPLRAGRRTGGRIHSATINSIVVDAIPTVAPGDTLVVALPTGLAQERVVNTVNTGTRTITVTVNFTAIPVAQSVWAVETADIALQTFRVLSVAENRADVRNFSISAIKHVPGKFDLIDNGTKFDTRPIAYVPPAVVPIPSGIVITQHDVIRDNDVQKVVNVSWNAVVGAASYEVQWRLSNGQWAIVPKATAANVDLTELRGGTFEVLIIAVDIFGRRSMPLHGGPYTIAPIATPPNFVDGLALAAADAQADADAANAALANIASDNLLTAGEKPTVIRDYSVITTEQAGIDAQATAYGITTSKVAYDNAVATLTAYLATLTSPVLWSNLTGNTTIVGTTFRTRFADVYTTRQTLLNAIYAAAKGLADQAQTTANNVGSTLPVMNPNFKDGTSGWFFDTSGSGEWYVETGSGGPLSGTTTYLVKKGVAAQTVTVAHNLGGGISVKPGQGVTLAVALRSAGAVASSRAYARIEWWNQAGGNIGNSTQGVTLCTPDAGAGNFTAGVSRVYGNAPAGAAYATAAVEYDGHTAGYYTMNGAVLSAQVATLDEVQDGSSKFGAIYAPLTQSGIMAPGSNLLRNATAALGNLMWGNAISGVALTPRPAKYYSGITSSSDPFWDTTTLGVDQGQACDHFAMPAGMNLVLSADMYTAGVTSGSVQVFIGFYNSAGTEIGTRQSITATLGTGWRTYSLALTTPAGCAAVSVFPRGTPTGGSALWRRLKLEVGTTLTPWNDWATQNGNQLTNPGSGQTLGDQFNAPNSLTMAYGSVNSTASLSATSAGAVSVAAFYVYLGNASAHYNAVANAVTGLTVGSTYQIYCHDPANTGGTKTWLATTSLNTMMTAGDDIVLAGSIKIPSSGSSGGGGSGTCPAQTAWVVRKAGDNAGEIVNAGSVRVGDSLLLANGNWGLVSGSVAVRQQCVKVVAEHGSLTCSLTAPLGLLDGTAVVSTESAGRTIRVSVDGVPGALHVVAVEPIADDVWTQHITVEDDFFWTGDDPKVLFSHHNRKVDPPP